MTRGGGRGIREREETRWSRQGGAEEVNEPAAIKSNAFVIVDDAPGSTRLAAQTSVCEFDDEDDDDDDSTRRGRGQDGIHAVARKTRYMD